MPSVTTSALTFCWPDGTPVLEGLDLTAGPGRHGLVGRNGVGKSTLLHLLAGRLRPTSGSVSAPGARLLPQDPAADPSDTVADVLGITGVLAALARIEAGSVDVADFDTVGSDWDVADRAEAQLGRLGLDHLDLDRRVGSLSGGELELLSLGALLLDDPPVLLLDEPTNNLDRTARARLGAALQGYRGTLLVVSHDRELLDTVDDIAELHRTGAASSRGTGSSTLRWYGGGWMAYTEALAADQQAARQAVTAAESRLRAERRDVADSQQVLATRRAVGRKAEREKRVPGIVAGGRKRAAQESAARYTRVHEERLAAAEDELAQAEERLRLEQRIVVDLPATVVPPRRRVLTLTGVRPAHGDVEVDLDLRGPERVGLVGRNGIGKTSLLRAVTGAEPPAAGEVEVHVPLRMMPQARTLLDPTLTVAQNVARHAPDADPTEIRSRLARFLFRGRDADQPASTLSGGERMRATLACLLLAEPAPQLLVLDEPTNDLDLPSIEQLVQALSGYRGALLVVSHDQTFLDELGPDRVVELSPTG
ncbi:ABC-F family ATP-binding cassette domain-containing protein [Desertihabitans brevis]|uniref:ABC-F family ATP-binding cassette domain-containing protein n=1 Tax=Desertihabitans brevis TaxID=2268447 RepID=UPI001F1DFC15|nr:ABC-F family ATP-binding cassette domain-containing protein [Desertihabitans brevis]